eukprot:gene23952-9523_t
MLRSACRLPSEYSQLSSFLQLLNQLPTTTSASIITPNNADLQASTQIARFRSFSISSWNSQPQTLQPLTSAQGQHHLASSRGLSSYASDGIPGSDEEDVADLPTMSEAPLILSREDVTHSNLTPQAVFEKLNRYIVLRQDITPKNLLMIGPTGCGKTEIARRLAKLADAPFVKVEATKFTEVGYHGKDVDSIIKDLVENAVNLVRRRLKDKMKKELALAVELQLKAKVDTKTVLAHRLKNLELQDVMVNVEVPLTSLPKSSTTSIVPPSGEAKVGDLDSETVLAQRLQNLELEDVMVDVEVPRTGNKLNVDLSGLQPQQLQQQSSKALNIIRFMAGDMKEQRKMSVAEDAESERMFPAETISREAIALAAQDGIVFIDEIDKVVTSRSGSWSGGDPSSEGVQRDLLPIIEGSTVQTKHGDIQTDHVLFICSGAFHSVKPSDLMAELQLKALTKEDFYRILTEPEYNLIKQQQMLLGAEGVELEFTNDALLEIASVAAEVNKTLENIGARRLHAILEAIMEPISFDAPDLVAAAKAEGKTTHKTLINKALVQERVAPYLKKEDLNRHII